MAISGIGASVASALTQSATAGSTSATGGFQDMLNDAISAADEADAADQAGTQALLTGNVNNISDAIIESEKASIALDLTVQIRNKVIDAYNEIMHMQV